MNPTESEIEDNVPLPTRFTTRRYPFNIMKVGQSFTSGKSVVSAVSANHKQRPQDGRFIARKEGDHYRVWRIK